MQKMFLAWTRASPAVIHQAPIPGLSPVSYVCASALGLCSCNLLLANLPWTMGLSDTVCRPVTNLLRPQQPLQSRACCCCG